MKVFGKVANCTTRTVGNKQYRFTKKDGDALPSAEVKNPRHVRMLVDAGFWEEPAVVHDGAGVETPAETPAKRGRPKKDV